MDFHGQMLAERLYSSIIAILSLLGFLVGYIQGSFRTTFNFWLFSVVLASVLTIPDWCCFKRNPIKWLEKIPEEPAEAVNGGEGTSQKKKKKKKKRR